VYDLFHPYKGFINPSIHCDFVLRSEKKTYIYTTNSNVTTLCAAIRAEILSPFFTCEASYSYNQYVTMLYGVVNEHQIRRYDLLRTFDTKVSVNRSAAYSTKP
jgi:hypothetical protein